jgi:hypothetical protein
MAEGESDRSFEKVFSVVTCEPNRADESWTLFERESYDDDEAEAFRPTRYIVRHCKWETSVDLKARSWKTGQGPTVISETRILPRDTTASLVDVLARLDDTVTAGVSLSRRRAAERPRWQSLSLYRQLVWGQFQLSWLNSLTSDSCEARISAVRSALEEALERAIASSERVYSMKMTYGDTPYLTLSCGLPWLIK